MSTLFTIVTNTVEFLTSSRQVVTESIENETMTVRITRDVYFPLRWINFNSNVNCQRVFNYSWSYVNFIQRFVKRHIIMILMMAALSMFSMHQYNELRNEMMTINETLREKLIRHDELFVVNEVWQENVVMHDELYTLNEALQEKVSMHDNRIKAGEIRIEEMQKQQITEEIRIEEMQKQQIGIVAQQDDIEKRQTNVESMAKFSVFWSILQSTFMVAWYFTCATASTGLSFLSGLIPKSV